MPAFPAPSVILVLLANLALPMPAWTQSRSQVSGHGVPGPLMKTTPSARLQAWGGELQGFDSGEWGGELHFVDAQGRSALLLEKNVVAIHRLAGQVIVVTGLSHMTIHEGSLWEVTRSARGVVAAKEVARLKGAPTGVRQEGDNALSFQVLVPHPTDPFGTGTRVCHRFRNGQLDQAACEPLPAPGRTE